MRVAPSADDHPCHLAIDVRVQNRNSYPYPNLSPNPNPNQNLNPNAQTTHPGDTGQPFKTTII